MAGKCVAKVDVQDDNGLWVKVSCEADTDPGYRYCEQHKNRKWAIKEREDKALGTVVEASSVFTGAVETNENSGSVVVKKPDGELTEKHIPLEQQNVYDKVQTELNDLIQWKNKTKDMMFTLHQEDFRYTDKAGAEQLHSFVTLYERAQDRVLRGVTAVAKLGIEAQSVNVNKMLVELIKGCVVKALRRHGMDEREIEQVRVLISDEFEKVDKEAS